LPALFLSLFQSCEFLFALSHNRYFYTPL
jgi:hypothetical protein